MKNRESLQLTESICWAIAVRQVPALSPKIACRIGYRARQLKRDNRRVVGGQVAANWRFWLRQAERHQRQHNNASQETDPICTLGRNQFQIDLAGGQPLYSSSRSNLRLPTTWCWCDSESRSKKGNPG